MQLTIDEQTERYVGLGGAERCAVRGDLLLADAGRPVLRLRAAGHRGRCAAAAPGGARGARPALRPRGAPRNARGRHGALKIAVLHGIR